MKDFFISYTQADLEWARWLDVELRRAGYQTVMQDADFGVGANFPHEIDRATQQAARTLLVLSPDYLKSRFCRSEWLARWVQDPLSQKRLLIPVRVRACDPSGLLGPIVFLDLVGLKAAAAQRALLEQLEKSMRLADGLRAGSDSAPFPGEDQEPRFPGRDDAVERGQKLTDLDAVRGSRSPIVIAVEADDAPIAESELLLFERHLTLRLDASQRRELAELGDRAALEACEPSALFRAGRRVWQILLQAQPRLAALFYAVASATPAQPIAWTGHVTLLAWLHRAILIARHDDTSGVSGLLTVGAGDHYFNPLAMQAGARNLPTRSIRAPETGVVDHVLPSEWLYERGAGAALPEFLMLSADDGARGLSSLLDLVEASALSRCRVVACRDGLSIAPELLQRALVHVPCLALGGAAVHQAAQAQELSAAIAQHGDRLSAPSIFAAFRRALVERHADGRDRAALVDALCWATWSWVGRPLFAQELGEIVPAAYPHLNDLRSIASKKWHVKREGDIAPRYRADALARSASEPDAHFHLYLSGAGGTGKSCVLRMVYERLQEREDALAVWYRVDAPSSAWDLVERRLKEETEAAFVGKLGEEKRSLVPDHDLQLGAFLMSTVEQLRRHGVKELVVFIDQLERTFESGDEPNPLSLRTISQAVMGLLQDVKVGLGVRVFIASRKQYLPDFLRSSEEAAQAGLEFNVLQAIDNILERWKFVSEITAYCKKQQLVDKDVRIGQPAAQRLAQEVGGNPLNMMLALIQIYTSSDAGEIDERWMERNRPWEKLFLFDLQLAGKDDLDWYFLLAMAAARTEIVRFDDVWWRLRLVSSPLTQRAEELGPKRVIERLWLMGHLGRTIHARPDDSPTPDRDPAAFLEFFHANLRDYLLRDVMGTGSAEIAVKGRSGGMPPAWRALDRLASAAREWAQTQYALAPEDVAVLMQMRDIVIERPARGRAEERQPFYLLFLRDVPHTRERLCRAARECFVYSAMVHGDYGRWAFDELFRDVKDKLACCELWLLRSSGESRMRVLQHLVELRAPEARAFTAALACQRGAAHELAQELADVLAQPLNAARYREEMVFACWEHVVREGRKETELPEALADLVVASCEGRRADVSELLGACAQRAEGSQDARVRALALELRSDALLNALCKGRLARAGSDAPAGLESAARAHPAIELVVSPSLRSVIEQTLSADFCRRLSERLGVPLPELVVGEGEMAEPDPVLAQGSDSALPAREAQRYAVELRFSGHAVAYGLFPPDRVRVRLRDLRRAGGQPPAHAPCVFDASLNEVVLWLRADECAPAVVAARALAFEPALFEWLEGQLRTHVERFFEFDLLFVFLREAASEPELVRLFRSASADLLLRIVVALVREHVPLFSHRTEIMQTLRRVVGRQSKLDTIVQRLRELESLTAELCAPFLDPSGRLHVIALDPALEDELGTRLVSGGGVDQLELGTGEARSLASAVRRYTEHTLERADTLPVLVTMPVLRRPLFELLQRFDRRTHVLSFTELPDRLRFETAGRLGPLAPTEHEGSRG